VKAVAERAGIPFLQPLKIRTPEFLAALNAWKPDMIAVTAFGRILHAPILTLPPSGCINVHGSLLPKYRGAAPVQWAVINGETETGITTMVMDEGMDTGPMLLQETLAILPDDTSGTLAPRLAELGGRLLVETIARLKSGTVTPRKQDDSRATLAPLLKKEDGLLDWAMSCESLHNRIRGLSPWPGAYTFLGSERWTIWTAAPHAVPAGEKPGTVVEVGKHHLLVATGSGRLELREIQTANSKRMPIDAFLAGHPVKVGTVLGIPPGQG
jgi:methionyl-tRNA formyltransferase